MSQYASCTGVEEIGLLVAENVCTDCASYQASKSTESTASQLVSKEGASSSPDESGTQTSLSVRRAIWATWSSWLASIALLLTIALLRLSTILLVMILVSTLMLLLLLLRVRGMAAVRIVLSLILRTATVALLIVILLAVPLLMLLLVGIGRWSVAALESVSICSVARERVEIFARLRSPAPEGMDHVLPHTDSDRGAAVRKTVLGEDNSGWSLPSLAAGYHHHSHSRRHHPGFGRRNNRERTCFCRSSSLERLRLVVMRGRKAFEESIGSEGLFRDGELLQSADSGVEGS